LSSQNKIESVPLLDLGRQYEAIGEEMEKKLIEIARSGKYVLGQAVEDFENEAAKYCGAQFGVGVTSGSDALIAALMAENIGPGDKVLTTPFSFFATVGAITRLGAVPVFVDIEPAGYNIDPIQIACSCTDAKAIIPVHLFGQCVDMDAITQAATQFGLVVIEDAAQAIGAEYKGTKAGSIGHYGCFSFFPSKNLGCMGDGGLVTTNDPEKAEKLRIMRNHGMKPKYYHSEIGGNFRLDAIQAGVLSVKLPYLDKWHEARRENAGYYMELFMELGIQNAVCPILLPDRKHIFNQFTSRVKNGQRDNLVNALRKKNIGCDVYYPVPLHLQECFAYLGHKEGDFPVAEKAAKEVMSIPIFPELTKDEMVYVANTIAEVIG